MLHLLVLLGIVQERPGYLEAVGLQVLFFFGLAQFLGFFFQLFPPVHPGGLYQVAEEMAALVEGFKGIVAVLAPAYPEGWPGAFELVGRDVVFPDVDRLVAVFAELDFVFRDAAEAVLEVEVLRFGGAAGKVQMHFAYEVEGLRPHAGGVIDHVADGFGLVFHEF